VCYLLHRHRASRTEQGQSRRHRTATYIGWTWQEPWFRLSQHNGHAPGGVQRLASGRPWAVALFVHGFFDATDARQFERAWQDGFNSQHLRHVSYFQPSPGATGRAEVLRVLLGCRSWYRHHLTVHLVRPDRDASQGEQQRFEQLRAALGNYPHVTYGPHVTYV